VRRTQNAVFVHLVWATWDRLPLLVATIERDVHRSIEAKCKELGAEIVALGASKTMFTCLCGFQLHYLLLIW
jgi:putative transposase